MLLTRSVRVARHQADSSISAMFEPTPLSEKRPRALDSVPENAGETS